MPNTPLAPDAGQALDAREQSESAVPPAKKSSTRKNAVKAAKPKASQSVKTESAAPSAEPAAQPKQPAKAKKTPAKPVAESQAQTTVKDGDAAQASPKNKRPTARKSATVEDGDIKANAAQAANTFQSSADAKPAPAAKKPASRAKKSAAAPQPTAAKATDTAPATEGVAAMQVAAAQADAPAKPTAPNGKSSGSRGRARSAKAPAAKTDSAKTGAAKNGVAEPAQASAPQPAAANLPEVKIEGQLAVREQNLPAPHVENLPARMEGATTAPSAGLSSDEGEAAPAKKSRRSRSRGRKNKAAAEEAKAAQQAAEASASENPPAVALDNGVEPETVKSAPAKDKNGKAAPKAQAKQAKSAPKSKRKMFVSVLAGEQVEVVIAEEGQIREYYVEMLHQAKIKGNIYKGVIHNVDPNLQAAFVSYGAAKNGFLQIDEVHPEYYLAPHEQGKGHKYPLMQKVLKAGQEILVQVVKEPSGTKGAFLTSYLSLPGRYLVLTPGREQIGVSRKVGNDEERNRLREILDGLNPGPGLGVIVRTVSEGASKTNLLRDLRFLKRLWLDVRKRGSTEEAPVMIYQELGLAARAVRDYFTEDITELWVDDADMAAQMQEVINLLYPKRDDILQIYKGQSQSLFDHFGLSRQITQVQSREVVLPSGGRLVFDHTEALTAIDINSGRSGGKSNFEDMAFKINLEAAQNIPLQLRLRDIGGQVVVDFIEMRDRNHWREVEKAFRAGMKEDRARHDVGKISSFGLLEVVRQRLGSSAISIASEPCPFCKGTGIRRNMEWQAMQALQDIQQLIRQNNENGKTLIYEAAGELVLYLLNNKKERLLEMEQDANVKLEIRPGI